MPSKSDSREKREQREKKPKKGNEASASPFSLLANEGAINPTLSSLFTAKPTPKVIVKAATSQAALNGSPDPSDSDPDLEAEDVPRLSDSEQPIDGDVNVSSASSPEPEVQSKRKRKRNERVEEVEDVYMRRLAQEEAKDAESLAKANTSKRQKTAETPPDSDDEVENVAVEVIDEDDTKDSTLPEDNEASSSPPPRHETEQAADNELSKANRTVFLGNVSTAAISSKSARKTLINHLKSFFGSITKPKDGETKHAVESIRFRSTPYANSVPKKAAFVTKQLMDATTKSTNAYAVYSSPSLAREAAIKLNATIVLDRHLRVDSVAHPSKTDNRRCVFVGNLGFVDDESNIQAANEEEGIEKRKPGKYPADIEEGLWRTFGKCGTVESVRVIRDSTTRVGKGIAYVQFDDANAVEAALLYDGKKFPPMLPRNLRVSRAKTQKRSAKPGSSRPSSAPKANGYQRKITGDEASNIGRANKLFGQATAAQMKGNLTGGRPVSNGLKAPEKVVFEGHRASSKGGKAGLKLAGRGKKKPGKPTNRSAKRSAAFKTGNKTKAK